MRDTKLTVTLHIGGQQVERLTSEQSARMAERLSDAMSIYYTAHPEEYSRVKGKQNERV